MTLALRTTISAIVLCSICLATVVSIPHPSQQAQTLATTEETALVLPVADPAPDTDTDVDVTSEPIASLIPDFTTLPTHLYEAGALGAVNFQSVWGDKEANIASMTEYIIQAADQGVQLLVFPEMCVTGYVLCDDPELWDYQMPIAFAESVDGPTAATFSALAQQYDMWIVYGATETAPGNQAYNAAFVCGPDGSVETYRKIAPVEGAWCAGGDTPLIVDAGDLGRIGIGICYDTYAHPELSQYYQAMDCDLYINLTASMVNYTDEYQAAWLWYYSARLESILYQTDMAIISANLVDSCSWRDFPGGSVIADDDSAFDVITQTPGLIVNQTALGYYDAPTVSSGATPGQIASWYEAIAQVSNNPKYDYTSSASPTVALAQSAWDDLSAFSQADILLLPDTGAVQPIPGSLTQSLSQLAQAQQQYILCAMTQLTLEEDTSITYTPVIAIVSPDGTVTTHQTEQTTLLQTPWGTFGVTLGQEIYTTPTLVRYYSAMGCKGILHIATDAPTDFQVDTILSTYVHRDGLAIASCSPDASYLLTPYHTSSGIESVDWSTGSAVDIDTNAPLVKRWSLQDTGFSISYFNATVYAQWFRTV